MLNCVLRQHVWSSERGFRSLASLILVVNVVGELQPKRTLAASRGFLAAARLSCTYYNITVHFDYNFDINMELYGAYAVSHIWMKMLTAENCGRVCQLTGKKQHVDRVDGITAVQSL